VSSGVGCRHGSDLVLLWLAAIAPTEPLAWELLCAAGVALKGQTTKKKKKKRRKNSTEDESSYKVHFISKPMLSLLHRSLEFNYFAFLFSFNIVPKAYLMSHFLRGRYNILSSTPAVFLNI